MEAPVSRHMIRKLLNEMFRTVPDLRAFFMDHFKAEFNRYASDGMNYLDLSNTLMTNAEADLIWTALKTAYPKEFATAQRKLKAGASPVSQREDGARSDSSRSPVPLPDDYVRVPRTTIAERILRGELKYERRATLLQVHRGGGRSLALELADLAVHDGMTPIWLEDFSSEQTGAGEFYQKLTDNPEVCDATSFYSWLNQQGSARPLIILYGTRGPADLIEEVASSISSFLTARSSDAAFLSVAGERLLRLCVPSRYFTSTLFAPATFVDVPELSLGEIRQLLALHDLPDALAALYYEHSGGHPGLLHRLVRQEITEPEGALACIRPELSSALNRHLENPQAHTVLHKLLRGEPVAPLSDPCVRHTPGHYAESRMYFDGLLRADEGGRTGFRCPAVRALLEGIAPSRSGTPSVPALKWEPK